MPLIAQVINRVSQCKKKRKIMGRLGRLYIFIIILFVLTTLGSFRFILIDLEES